MEKNGIHIIDIQQTINCIERAVEAVVKTVREGGTILFVGRKKQAKDVIVEEAQRFGLAQLHQLRGRIGRGEFASYCLLVSKASTASSRKRLKVMTETTDGFQIAQEDLGIRGPGEFLGTRQHGLPEFKIGNIVSDLKILEEARRAAFTLVKKDPTLARPEYQLLKRYLQEKFQGKFKLISVS